MPTVVHSPILHYSRLCPPQVVAARCVTYLLTYCIHTDDAPKGRPDEERGEGGGGGLLLSQPPRRKLQSARLDQQASCSVQVATATDLEYPGTCL